MHYGCNISHMPKAIQIRGVPDDVHRTLRERAARVGQSLSNYLLDEVTRIAARPPVADTLARAGTRHGGARPEAIVEAQRLARDRR